MTGRSKGFRTHVSRRDFLTLAAGGAAWVVTAGPGSQILGEASSGVQSEGAETLDTGGIAMEHFEAARKRAASMVAKLTLSEKISQFGASAAAVERVGLPAFDYYATEGLHGLLHTGPVTVFPLPLALGAPGTDPSSTGVPRFPMKSGHGTKRRLGAWPCSPHRRSTWDTGSALGTDRRKLQRRPPPDRADGGCYRSWHARP